MGTAVCFASLKFFAFFQELQRRLDQTLGKPGNYHHGIDKEGHIKPMTIGGRLYRLENQVCIGLYMRFGKTKKVRDSN